MTHDGPALERHLLLQATLNANSPETPRIHRRDTAKSTTYACALGPLCRSSNGSSSSRPAAAAAPLVLVLVGLVGILGIPLFRLLLRIVVILRVD